VNQGRGLQGLARPLSNQIENDFVPWHFGFVCEWQFHFEFSVFQVRAFSRRLLRVGFEQRVNFSADFFAHSD
jgi:hypothetical protein